MRKKEFGIYHFKSGQWGVSDFDLIKAYKNHGFSYVCFYANYQPVELIKKCIIFAREIGLKVNTVHGPLLNNSQIWEENYEDYLSLLKDYIKMCGELKIRYFIMHTAGKECLSFSEIGLKNFKELVILAKKYRVIILGENLRTIDHLIFLTEKIKSKYFQICLDFGHANVWCYSPADFISKYKRHIKAVHIHDNFGPNSGDLHLIPFKGNINWVKLMPCLHMYYKGPITLELDNFKTEEFKYDNLDEYLDDAYKSAELLDNYKNWKIIFNTLLKYVDFVNFQILTFRFR